MPINDASTNKGTHGPAHYSVEEANAIMNGQNRHSFLSNSPIFNPKAPLESWEHKLSPRTYHIKFARVHTAPLLGEYGRHGDLSMAWMEWDISLGRRGLAIKWWTINDTFDIFMCRVSHMKYSRF